VTALTTNTQAGQSCQVSIQLNSQGNEDAVGFSLAFDPALLTFSNAVAGSGANGSTFLVNTNAATNGLVGIALELPFFSTFSAGTQELAKLTFQVTPYAAGHAQISFTNQPVLEDVADANASSLPVSYNAGSLSISNPLLTIMAASHLNGKLVLTWSAALSGYNLESSTNLTGSNWKVVSSGIATNGSTVTLTNLMTNSAMFYRLHHP
jgi:hypothetical protein